MPPKPRHNDRRCVATGEALEPDALAIRFVLAPDGTLFADLPEKMPGRGAWVTASRSHLLKALKKGGFSRSFKTQARLPEGVTPEAFADDVGRALEARALSALGLARRAGALVAGFEAVRSRAPQLLAYVTPSDAAPDGVRKITGRLETGGTGAHIPVSATAEALATAVGEPGAVHFGLLPGSAGQSALFDLCRWNSFVPGDERASSL